LDGGSMKYRFLDSSIHLIKKYHPEVTDTDLEEYRYGLEGFYLTVQKTVIIVPIAICLGIFKNLLILLIAFNLLRKYACGMHASNSISCLCFSASIFLFASWVSNYFIMPLIVKIFISIIGILVFARYAPADTEKAPIIRIEKRKKKKRLSLISLCFLILLMFIIPDMVITNLIMFGIVIEGILILPITYFIFHHRYNNYKTYLESMG
jgi:accessory gene regulator B